MGRKLPSVFSLYPRRTNTNIMTAKKAATAPVKTQVEKEKEVAQVEARAKQADSVLAPVVKVSKADTSDIEVEDPELLMPKELPLVIKPKGGKWKNDEQVAYAKVLNAYAYKNPKKWKANKINPKTLDEIPNTSKKDICIEQLAKLEKHPELFEQFTGNRLGDKISYKNQLMEN